MNHSLKPEDIDALIQEKNRILEENKRLYAALTEAMRMLKHSCHRHSGRCGRCENDEKTLYEIVQGKV